MGVQDTAGVGQEVIEMRKLAILSVLVMVLLTSSCQFITGEAPDDITHGPGGPGYRANFHQQGEENPWPPIKSNEVVLGDDADAAYVRYRSYIETKAGQVRNNIFSVRIPSKDIGDVSIEVRDIPSGMEVNEGMKWYGPRVIATVLEIEISRQVKPGEYVFDVSVKIDGKDYGTVPCAIKVLD